jgi:UDP-glucose 4-epimerase
MTTSNHILITGGAGFLGSSIARRLLAEATDTRITILDPRVPSELMSEFPGRILHDSRGVVEFLAEVPNSEYTTLIHLAWTSHPATSMQFPAEDLTANVLGGVQLLERCTQLGVRRLIFASSGGTVYGPLIHPRADELHPTNPISAYGAAKLSFEHYAQVIGVRDGFEVVSLRVSNPYGPYQLQGVAVGSIANFLLRAKNDKAISIFGDGSVVRDYINIQDVANAFAMAVNAPHLASGPYNVGSGLGTNLNEVIELIEQVSGKHLVVRREPARGFDVARNVLDCSRLDTSIGWRPAISLEGGIEAMWQSLWDQ